MNAESKLPVPWISAVGHQVRDAFWMVLYTLVQRRKTKVENNETRELACNILIFTLLSNLILFNANKIVAKINFQSLANRCMCSFMYLQLP